jgi:hypothetical protein
MAINGIMAGGLASGFLQGFQSMGQELARQGTIQREARQDEREQQRLQMEADIKRRLADLEERQLGMQEQRTAADIAHQQTQDALQGKLYGLKEDELQSVTKPQAAAEVAYRYGVLGNQARQTELDYSKFQAEQAARQRAEQKQAAQQRLMGQWLPMAQENKELPPEAFADMETVSGIPAKSWLNGEAANAVKTFDRLFAGEIDMNDPLVHRALETTYRSYLDRGKGEPIALAPGPGGQLSAVPAGTPGAVEGTITGKRITRITQIPEEEAQKVAQRLVQAQPGLTPEQALAQARHYYGAELQVDVQGRDGRTYSYRAPLTMSGSTDPNDPVVFASSNQIAKGPAAMKMMYTALQRDPAFLRGMKAYAESGKTGPDAYQQARLLNDNTRTQIQIEESARKAREERRQADKDARAMKESKLKALSDQADMEFTTADDMGVKSYDAERASRAKALAAEMLKANPEADWPTIWAQVRQRMGAGTPQVTVPADANGKKDYRGMLRQYVGGGAAD